jgi:hypothetical protein
MERGLQNLLLARRTIRYELVGTIAVDGGHAGASSQDCA